MELVAILFMLIGGCAIAAFVLVAMAISRRSAEPLDPLPPHRDSIAASLLFHVVAAGGARGEEALRAVRRGAGLGAPVTRGIDVTNWAESFARMSSPEQRSSLLETAVRLVAADGTPVPLRQYAALLDLSFGLGFQTDALAKLRQVYGFEYVDHARDARLRSAHTENLTPGAPFRQGELLVILGLTGSPTRQELTATYRRLVRRYHPDRFHGAPEEARMEAAGRFMEITRAYEELLLRFRD